MVPDACTWLAKGRFLFFLFIFFFFLSRSGVEVRLLTMDSDGNIRYYEYENDEFIYLSEYKSTEPQRGIAFVPRRGLNVSQHW
jgi:hypothetical protein